MASPELDIRRPSRAASPLDVVYSARIHFPDFSTSVQIPSRHEMLQIPEKRLRSSSTRRSPAFWFFWISRNVPRGSCMISLMIAFQYIVSFLAPGVVNLPVTRRTNANPLSATGLLTLALYGPVENIRYRHRYWRREPFLKRCDPILPFSSKNPGKYFRGRKEEVTWYLARGCISRSVFAADRSAGPDRDFSGEIPGPLILPLWGRGSNGFIFCFCGLYQHILRKNTPIY